MPREKELFRDNLAELKEAFPGKNALTREEVARYMRVSVTTVRRRDYPFDGKTITLVKFARALS